MRHLQGFAERLWFLSPFRPGTAPAMQLATALGKQAKILNDRLIHVMLGAIEGRRYPLRQRVMILLSVTYGLRAKAITERAYRRKTALEKRRRLVQAWTDY
jgi:hypothetical protein